MTESSECPVHPDGEHQYGYAGLADEEHEAQRITDELVAVVIAELGGSVR